MAASTSPSRPTCSTLAASGQSAPSALVALQLRIEPGEVGWVERRRVTGRRLIALVSSAFALAGGHTERDAEARREDGEHRREVGGDVEAVVLGQREYARAVFGRQRALDLLLRAASVDQTPDVGSFAFGLRRIGEPERHAADRAHDLVLDVGERRLWAARRRGGGGRQE